MLSKAAFISSTLALGSCVTVPIKNADTDVIDAQYAAYNAKDIDKFMDFFASSARICTMPAHACLEGAEQIRAHFSEMFSRVIQLEAKISKRIVDQNHILDWEHVTLTKNSGESQKVSALSVYRVDQGKITSLVLFMRDGP